MIVLGDMNSKVGNKNVDEVVGKWGVPGRNDTSEWLVDICAEGGLLWANIFFQNKMIHRVHGKEVCKKSIGD